MTEIFQPKQLLDDVRLDDKFAKSDGSALMTGMQALVRLTMHIHDRAALQGKNLGGYISGYRGSPVGTYDMALWAAKEYLEPRHIHFQPGVNEDLAATAVWGSQQVHLLGESKYDGVFGIWYGKSPGVDRTLDVFRHANYAGTAAAGGVLAIAGDDPNAVSSTVTGCSDHDFLSVGMPIIYPSSVQEMIDFGLLGIEMSRYSGCWVAMKAVTDIAESTAIVDVNPQRIPLSWSETESDPASSEVHIHWPDNRVEQERRLYEIKLPRARRFARIAKLNQRIVDPSNAKVGIISAGKPWGDLMQTLQDLGISQDDLYQQGVRTLKLGLIYPLDPQEILEFSAGLETILIIEEKRGFIEDQLKSILFSSPIHPQVLGKLDPQGRTLIPEYGECTPAQLAEVIDRVLPYLTQGASARQRIADLNISSLESAGSAVLQARTPYFCSGCPHNSSTRVPEGSIALAGIGCHWLALFMGRDNETFTQMGGEGATWLGVKEFSSRKHVFANMGDGTYHHSGLLAVRAAVYANANMTYKVLYNDAVAMTGGQIVADTFTPQQIAGQLLAEGVIKIAVVSDNPSKYREVSAANGGFPVGVTLHARDELDAVQRTLQQTSGVTALIYDQTCAAEKRRRRKRGKMADPDVRAFINEAVCEGCGDCSVESNCISVEPSETDFGRKRRINQSSCNKDIKCVDGFCPSFVTLQGAIPRKAPKLTQTNHLSEIPMPSTCPIGQVHDTVITGIGGTGVITIGAILAMAARLEGLNATCLDQTGIAQKNGAVLSHIRISTDPTQLHVPRIASRNANLVLGCDMMVAASAPSLATMRSGITQVVLNTHLAPNAAFVTNPIHAEFGAQDLRQAIGQACGSSQVREIAATALALKLFGDAIAANMILLGFALQKGWLPITLASIEQAITLNGVAVKANLSALAAGRRAALNEDLEPPQIVTQVINFQPKSRQSIDALIDHRRLDLQAYQNQAYANRYTALIERLRQAEQAAYPGNETLVRIVAEQAYRVMSYKDEYEVARLYTDGRFQRALSEQFEDGVKISFHLAPPLFSNRDPRTGHLRKKRYGAWIFPAMQILTRFKGLRGSAFDPFGYTTERRLERQLSSTYLDMIEKMASSIDVSNHRRYIEIARQVQSLRGFGHIKERNFLDMVEHWIKSAKGTPVEPVIAGFAQQVQQLLGRSAGQSSMPA